MRDTIPRAYSALYVVWPRGAIALGALVGRLAGWTRPVEPETLARYLDETPGPRHRVWARKLARDVFRRRMLAAAVRRRGWKPLTRAIRCEGFDLLKKLHREKKPGIVVFCHLGPIFATSTALGQAGIPCLLLIGGDKGFRAPPGVEVLDLATVSAVAALKKAHDHLAAGGILALSADGGAGTAETGPGVLGSRRRLRRGIAALHSLTGADVVPLVITLGTTCLRAQASDPIRLPAGTSEGDREELMHRALREWVASVYRAHPEALSPVKVNSVIRR